MTYVSTNKIKRTRIVHVSFMSFIIALGLLICPSAQAQELDGAALQKLAIQDTWVAEHPEFGNWTWNTDETVCVHLRGTDNKCTDTGAWVMNDNVICYELTWWGGDTRKNCFTVQELGEGRFETLYHGGAMVSTFFYFNLAN
jgi:hypothetical protein